MTCTCHTMTKPGVLYTGIDALDGFLGGVLQRGIILDVYGPGGSGKSHVLMRAAAEAAAGGFRVALVDTTGHFRPERLLQISSHDILDAIMVLRATSVAEQVAVPSMTGDVDLLLIDNVTDLFAYEYSDERSAPDRGRMLAMHMRDISWQATHGGMAVIVANTMRYTGNGGAESMQHVMDMYTHTKLWLSGAPEYEAEYRRWDAIMRFTYAIYDNGIRSDRIIIR